MKSEGEWVSGGKKLAPNCCLEKDKFVRNMPNFTCCKAQIV